VLTDRDIHYLSGLLLLVSTDVSVRVDLGKRILDETIDKRRDVDIVLTTILKGVADQSFGGIEVKDHHRKLDVTHVEQLGTKLRDMPSLSQRGIVSASGYTNTALRKCEAYDVIPLDLRSFTPSESPFDHVVFPQNFTFDCPQLIPHGPVGLRYMSESNDSLIDASETEKPCKWLMNGVSHEQVDNIGQLNNLILKRFLDAMLQEVEHDKGNQGPFPFDRVLAFDGEENFLETDGVHLRVSRIVIQGSAVYRVVKTPVEWRALTRADSGDYLAGAGIAIMPDESLLGIALTHEKHKPRIIRIPPEERAKRVIRNLHLGRG